MQESGREIARHAFPAEALPEGIGDAVARERRKRRWSQSRLAEKANLDRASIQRLEAGAGRGVRPDTLFRVAHALDLDLAKLVPGWPEWRPVDGPGHGPRTRERRRALGLSLAELAAAAGVSEATLSRHERGVGTSPALLRRSHDDFVACNDSLAIALGFADCTEFSGYCQGFIDAPAAVAPSP